MAKNKDDNIYQVITAIDSRDQALKMSRILVEEHLAACVQLIGPVTSTYRWQGNIEQSEEFLLLIKTSCQRYDALENRIKELHPYELPEIVAVKSGMVSSEFEKWVKDNTNSIQK